MPYEIGTADRFHNIGGGPLPGWLQLLLDFCVGDRYEETVGTGTGSSAAYPFTLLNTPMAKGNVRLSFRQDGTRHYIFDDGVSWDHHDLVSSSSINYTTGVCTATLRGDNTTNVNVLYCVGQNSGEEGRDWLWLTDQYTKNKDGTFAYPGELLKEVVLRNSGVSYKENIYVGFRESKYVVGNYYPVQLNTYYDYNPLDGNWNYNEFLTGKDSYNATLKAYADHPQISLNDSTMAHWTMASKQRIMGVVRVSATVFESFYVGAGFRFASPINYANPLIALGSSYGQVPYTSEADQHKFIVEPHPSGNSYFVVNHEDNYKFGSEIRLPMHFFNDEGIIAKSTNDKVDRDETYIKDVSTDSLLFELEGVQHCPCTGIAAEDTLTEGAQTWLVVQDVFRTLYRSYMAMELA